MLKQKFKKTNTEEVKQQAQQASVPTTTSTYKFKEGINRFRILPQPIDSFDENFFLAAEYSVFNPVTNQYEFYAIVDGEGEYFINKISTSLFFSKDDALKNLASFKNKDALKLSTSPKVFAQAINLENGELVLLKMPGTRPARKDYIPKKGLGSKVIEISEKEDYQGNLIYGDIVDPYAGRNITITALNAGTLRAEYELQVDEGEAPLIKGEDYNKNLDKVKPFRDVINIVGVEELKEWFLSYLPDDALAFLSEKNIL
jgi:hypothetical protein